MARGKMKDRKLAFWLDGSGFVKGFGKFTLIADEAAIFKNSSEVRKAQKQYSAFPDLNGIKVIEFPEIKDHKRKE